MRKKLIILADWESESVYQQLKRNIENNISEVDTFSYLLIVQHLKRTDELPVIKAVHYILKKDFNFLRQLKNTGLKDVLKSEKSKMLIVATEKNTPLLRRVLKNTELKTIGLEKETLPNFDLSFKDIPWDSEKFYKQINKFLTKIQL